MLALTIYAAIVGTIGLALVLWKYLAVYCKKVTVSASVGGVWGFDSPQVSIHCENKTKRNFIVTNIGMTAKGRYGRLGEKSKKKSDVWYLTGNIDVYPEFPRDDGTSVKLSLPTTLNPTRQFYAYLPVDMFLNYLMNYGPKTHVTFFVEDDSKNGHKSHPIETDVGLWSSLLCKEWFTSVE